MRHKTVTEPPRLSTDLGEAPELLRVEGLCKAFGPIHANTDISFGVRSGQIHALLGENGAGKSTLVKTLYGVHQPDGGRISVDGDVVTVDSPARARELGIGLVFQDMRLIPALTVWENVALFLADTGMILRSDEIAARVTEASERWGLAVEPRATVADLSIGEWQRVELLKVLMGGARLLILDEPTSVLAPTEVGAFFEVVTHLRDAGVGVILITHKLREVRQIADRITVLRGGKVVISDVAADDIDDHTLVTAMVGHDVERLATGSEHAVGRNPALELAAVTVRRTDGTLGLDHVSLRFHPGEVVGIAGVAGNGQDELVDVLTGVREPDSGDVLIGDVVKRVEPGLFRREGVVAVVPDPVQQFVVPGLTIAEHCTLWDEAAGGPGRRRHAAERFRERADLVGLPVAEPHRALSDLSGGNIQRVLLTLALSSDARALVLSYPTRGLDVSTAQKTREAILRARDGGAAVVVVSEDLDELAEISDRVAVLAKGRVAGVLDASEAGRGSIGSLMTQVEDQ